MTWATGQAVSSATGRAVSSAPGPVGQASSGLAAATGQAAVGDWTGCVVGDWARAQRTVPPSAAASARRTAPPSARPSSVARLELSRRVQHAPLDLELSRIRRVGGEVDEHRVLDLARRREMHLPGRFVAAEARGAGRGLALGAAQPSLASRVAGFVEREASRVATNSAHVVTYGAVKHVFSPAP